MHDPPPGALDDVGDLEDDPGPSPLVRTLRPVLITAVLAVLVLGGFALASHLWGATRTETGELDLEGSGLLRLQAGPTDVRVVQGDVTVPRYVARVTSGLFDTHFEVERVGGATRLEAACRPLLSPGCGVDVTITVPEGTAVDLLTGSGDVDVSGLDGAVAVRTGSGDVEVERLRTQDLTVRSNSGDVEATFARPPFAVKVATGSGDVDLGLPQTRTPYAVDARSESGEVDDAIPATDAQDARVVRVRTQAGDVEVEQDAGGRRQRPAGLATLDGGEVPASSGLGDPVRPRSGAAAVPLRHALGRRPLAPLDEPRVLQRHGGHREVVAAESARPLLQQPADGRPRLAARIDAAGREPSSLGDDRPEREVPHVGALERPVPRAAPDDELAHRPLPVAPLAVKPHPHRPVLRHSHRHETLTVVRDTHGVVARDLVQQRTELVHRDPSVELSGSASTLALEGSFSLLCWLRGGSCPAGARPAMVVTLLVRCRRRTGIARALPQLTLGVVSERASTGRGARGWLRVSGSGLSSPLDP